MHRSKCTGDEAIGEGEDELVEVREDVVIEEIVILSGLYNHQRDGEEEVEPAEKEIRDAVGVEGLAEVSYDFVDDVSEVVHEEEDKRGPYNL